MKIFLIIGAVLEGIGILLKLFSVVQLFKLAEDEECPLGVYSTWTLPVNIFIEVVLILGACIGA